MSTDPAPTVVTTADEPPEANLRRIQADTARLRDGWDAFVAEQRGADTELCVVAIDIDSSAQVRQHGIEAKVELVGRCREAIEDGLDPRVTVIDSGTRDETFLVLQDVDEAAAIEVAEAVRARVAARLFTLDTLGTSVSVTVSCGVGHGRADDLDSVIEASQAGLVLAKRTRDAVGSGTCELEVVTVAVPTSLAPGGDDDGSPARLETRAVEDVVMAMTGIRHWLLVQGLETGRLTPDSWQEQIGSPADADASFMRLCRTVAEAWQPVADRSGGTSGAGLDLAELHRRRFGEARTSVEVAVPASQMHVWRSKLVGGLGLSMDDLATECLALATAHPERVGRGDHG